MIGRYPEIARQITGSGEWKTVRFEIDDAYFGNRENGGDFRIYSNTDYDMNIARVRLILDESSGYAVTVPDVLGQTQAVAQSNLAVVSLNFGTVTEDYSSSEPAGVVLSQDPISGIDSIAGLSVDLVISRGTMCFGSADFDCDGKVDISDFSYMASVWLTNDQAADIAAPDGQVETQDLLLLAQQWTNNALLDTTAAYWKLNESASAVAQDYSTNSHNGTLINMDDSDWMPGKTGNALNFDGIDDYVVVSGFNGITGTTNRTCMAWIKTTVGGDILSYGNDAATGTKWRFMVASDGRLLVKVGGSVKTMTAAVNDGNWHHIAVVVPDKSVPLIEDMRLFIDGSRITDILTSSGTEPINTGTDNTVNIGVYKYADTTTGHFEGLIDDIRIYDRALSETEINIIAQ